MESYRREYEFSLSSILSFVWRGVIVGCVSGSMVSLFRLLIAKIFAQVVKCYQLSHENPALLGLILLVSVIVVIAIGFWLNLIQILKALGFLTSKES